MKEKPYLINLNQINLIELTQKQDACFTTSEIIAQETCRSHWSIIKLIGENREDLDVVDKNPIQLEVEEAKTKEGNTYKKKVYKLTRAQAMLLITHMKDNKASGNKISQFKLKLIKQFNLMEKYIYSRKETRTIGKQVFRSLTDIIQINNEINKDKQQCLTFIPFSYALYQDLIYKKLFNQTSKELKKKYHLPNNMSYKDIASLEELEKIQRLEDQVQLCILKNKYYLLKSNEAYQKVKAFLGLNN